MSLKKLCLNLAWIDSVRTISGKIAIALPLPVRTSHARSLSEIPMATWGMSYAQVQLLAGVGHDPASRNDIQDKHPESRHRSASGEGVEHNSGGYPQGD